MKIMTAMYTLKKGGSYERFRMMIEAFINRRCEVHCISLTPINIDSHYFKNYIMYYPFSEKDGKMAKFIVAFLFPIFSLWVGWKEKIDLIISFGFLYTLILGFSKLFLRKPLVTFVRGNLIFTLTNQNLPKSLLWLSKGIVYLGLILSDKVITNNVSQKEEILRLLKNRKNISVETLYNNIQTIKISKSENILQIRDRYGIPVDAKVLVTSGLINRGKNLKMLIKCLYQIKIKNLYLIIIGDSSSKLDYQYKKELINFAKYLEVDNRVIFTGWLKKKDLWEIYIASNLFILASKNEGMPNSMLEALGLDLPCIGSNVPGIIDILQYDELVFNPLDEEALVKKIKLFFSDNQFSNHVGRLCQERKEAFNFNWDERLFQIVTNGFHR